MTLENPAQRKFEDLSLKDQHKIIEEIKILKKDLEQDDFAIIRTIKRNRKVIVTLHEVQGILARSFSIGRFQELSINPHDQPIRQVSARLNEPSTHEFLRLQI